MENLFEQLDKKELFSLCAQYLTSIDSGHCPGGLLSDILKAYGYADPDKAFCDRNTLWREHLTEVLCVAMLLSDPERSRTAKVIPCKAKNSLSWKLVLPKAWITKMNITPESREACVIFDGRSICVRKWHGESDLLLRGSKKANIIFSTIAATSNAQYKGCRLSLPDSWMKEMQITGDNRDVLLQYEKDSIRITKC